MYHLETALETRRDTFGAYNSGQSVRQPISGRRDASVGQTSLSKAYASNGVPPWRRSRFNFQ